MSPPDVESTRAPTDDSRTALGHALDHLLDPLEGFVVVPLRPTAVEPEQHKAPAKTPQGLRRGENVQATIAVRASKGRKGSRAFVAYKVGEPCPVCGGSGRQDRARADKAKESDGVCTRCHGKGRVEVERELSIVVPPGTSDGAQLRVRGEGSRPDGKGEPGDLLLYVNVLPRARLGARLSRAIGLD